MQKKQQKIFKSTVKQHNKKSHNLSVIKPEIKAIPLNVRGIAFLFFYLISVIFILSYIPFHNSSASGNIFNARSSIP